MNSQTITRDQLAKLFDHTLLKAFATKEALEGLVKYSDDAIIFNKHLCKFINMVIVCMC